MEWRSLGDELPKVYSPIACSYVYAREDMIWVDVYITDGRAAARGGARFSFPPGKGYDDLSDTLIIGEKDSDACDFLGWTMIWEDKGSQDLNTDQLRAGRYWEYRSSVDKHLLYNSPLEKAYVNFQREWKATVHRMNNKRYDLSGPFSREASEL